MNNEVLHIYEEETNLIWVPVIVVAAAAATYLLSGIFISDVSVFQGVHQIVALLLILLSFYGILKISEPLYHFTFQFEGDDLTIHAKKGEQEIKTIVIDVHDIAALKFAPARPRSPGEALFDYSTTYHLMWKSRHSDKYRRLLDLGSAAFYLKVHDIARVIRFVRRLNTQIYVPPDQASFFNL